jgi:hypothetical protein
MYVIKIQQLFLRPAACLASSLGITRHLHDTPFILMSFF